MRSLKRYKLFFIATIGILPILIFTRCQEDNIDHSETKVSDAYVTPYAKQEVEKVERKATGFEYDYENLIYDLVWADEFDYEGLPDETKWNYDIGGNGWGNNELQYYTDGKNVTVGDGNLVIEARKEEYEGMNYTSTRLVSRDKGDWLYCKIEVSAKLPVGIGTWPAIWMLPTDWEYGPWPASGEIDIMEHVGYDQNKIYSTIHSQSNYDSINTQKSASKYVEGASDGFHVYSIEWLPDKILAYIDGELYLTFDPNKYAEIPTYKEWPFDKRMHLLLNIAVGGSWGGAKGIDENIYPQQMLVDYVRVYQSEKINELIKK